MSNDGIQKVWGRTRCIYASPWCSEHQLQITPGGYCSLHYHAQRANRFLLEHGTLAVVQVHGWRVDRRILTPGNVLDVPSHVVHQFQAESACALTEIYWPDRGGEISESDIIRLSEGGIVDPSAFVGMVENAIRVGAGYVAG